jgi:outer membrane protein OmpA-like peptidoglycan-associated protein
MRCNWHRWLWGLIPLIAVGWLAVVVERGRIEQDLSARANRAMSDSSSPWASVSVNGRDLVLTGRAGQEDEPPKVEAVLRNVWGVREVDNRAVLPRKVEPFLWSARRRGNHIRISGYVPDRATRQTVIGLTKAAMPGLDVTDRMNTARGVPPVDTWLAGLSFALKQLSSMRHGDARFEGLALSISGEAEDAAAFKSLHAAIKGGLPKGIQLANAQITAPAVSPFTWSAQLAGGQLILTGYVSGGDSARESLVTAIKSAVADVNVVDRMEQAEGAPPAWANAAVALLKAAAPLDNGTLEMKDAAFTVSGMAADQAKAQAVRAALRGALPSGFTLADQIRVREPLKPAEPKPAEAKSPEPSPGAPVQPAPPQAGQAEAQSPAADAVPQKTPPAAPEQKTTLAPPSQPPPAPPAAVPAPKEPAPSPPAPPAAGAEQPKTAAAPPPSPPPSPAVIACQQSLQGIASAGQILFDTDSATLDPSSFETLDRLAVAAKACPNMRIAIEGHTDSEGSVDYNQRLSVRRAQAVAAYLVKAGADSHQLEAVGYGVSRPAVPNDTPENMARNRRIEFNVRQQ